MEVKNEGEKTGFPTCKKVDFFIYAAPPSAAN
jgi:hypothetical protein